MHKCSETSKHIILPDATGAVLSMRNDHMLKPNTREQWIRARIVLVPRASIQRIW